MRPCPVCWRDDCIRLQWMGRAMQWRYICICCGHDGPGAETAEKAREAWENQD